MRIFYSAEGDPMLLDSVAGLSAFAGTFRDFLDSERSDAAFAADTDGDPRPYSEFLPGLRVTRGGATELRMAADRWLELQGELPELRRFAEKLPVARDQDHRHWYSSPVSLIIEADDAWPDG